MYDADNSGSKLAVSRKGGGMGGGGGGEQGCCSGSHGYLSHVQQQPLVRLDVPVLACQDLRTAARATTLSHANPARVVWMGVLPLVRTRYAWITGVHAGGCRAW